MSIRVQDSGFPPGSGQGAGAGVRSQGPGVRDQGSGTRKEKIGNRKEEIGARKWKEKRENRK
jgi:hypothetical protein